MADEQTEGTSQCWAKSAAFRYITVDAYLSAIDFYCKNGFKELTKKEEDDHTRLMFFDMMDVL